jgi:hypothetical protein
VQGECQTACLVAYQALRSMDECSCAGCEDWGFRWYGRCGVVVHCTDERALEGDVCMIFHHELY